MTKRQKAVLKFINEFYERNKYFAVMTDIRDEFHIHYEGAKYAVYRLQSLGYVDWVRKGKFTQAIIPLWKE